MLLIFKFLSSVCNVDSIMPNSEAHLPSLLLLGYSFKDKAKHQPISLFAVSLIRTFLQLLQCSEDPS